MTVVSVFEASTHWNPGTRTAGSETAGLEGSATAPLTRAAGGVWPARRYVASATAAWSVPDSRGRSAWAGHRRSSISTAWSGNRLGWWPRRTPLDRPSAPATTIGLMSDTPNRLAAETSPYLLQHARNPVDWYPWGPEALARAKQADRPIFLSIGYAACHWCHVMERESFEDPETAAILNAGFVAIKVDREERPDLDAVYMAALQSMTGGGGWPMSLFLTPDGRPFYGAACDPCAAEPGLPTRSRTDLRSGGCPDPGRGCRHLRLGRPSVHGRAPLLPFPQRPGPRVCGQGSLSTGQLLQGKPASGTGSPSNPC